ncbi:TetR family transcriptional regulator [Kitasatospora sp. NPDC056651]|uniref:TetR/AcrR family transcriptional regulator n=1 Tax=Kitasatospora sp. NPDC056651 TaxID=3345892 RepID=UPI0036B85953
MSEPPTPRPRRSSALTRQAIHDAARELFNQDGFGAVGIRAVAARAGVDAALVIRHFGSKERLFVEAMSVDLPAARILQGPLDGMGRTLVAHVVDLSSSTAGSLAVASLAALFRASDRAEVQRSLRTTIERAFADPLAPRLAGADAELRAHLVAAQIGGLLTSLHVVEDEVLVSADRTALVAHYGDAVQRLIDGRQ